MSRFLDSKNNTLFAENFEYDLEKKIITAQNKVKFSDNRKNLYYFSKIVADDKFNEIIGYDLDSNLNKEKFKSREICSKSSTPFSENKPVLPQSLKSGQFPILK